MQASGSSTFSYQWQFKGANIPNATNATLTVTNVQAANTGAYRVTVSNAAGSTTSDEALLQFPPPATKSYAETVRQDDPVAYWKLDETSGDVALDSIGSNNGTYLNGVTLGVPGIGATNTAAGFSAESQQKVDVPFSAALNTPVFTSGALGRSSPAAAVTDRRDFARRWPPTRLHLLRRPGQHLAILERQGRYLRLGHDRRTSGRNQRVGAPGWSL